MRSRARTAPVTTSFRDAFASPSNVCVRSPNDARHVTLPDSIRRLVNLRGLLLNKNALDSLPDALRSLRHLTRVHIGGSPRLDFEHLINQLAALPERAGLGLDDNRFGCLPTNIDLFDNQIRRAPASIQAMPWIETEFLCANSLDSLHLLRMRVLLRPTKINLSVPPELWLMAPYRS